MIAWSIVLFQFLITLKSIIVCFTQDDHIVRILSDTFYMMGHHAQLNAILATAIGASAFGRIILLVMENTGRVHMINFIYFLRQDNKFSNKNTDLNENVYEIEKKLQKYQQEFDFKNLDKKNHLKFLMRCRICNSLIDLMIYFVTTVGMLATTLTSIFAYLDPDKEGIFTPFYLLIWIINLTLSLFFAFTLFSTFIFISYITCSYLVLQFGQINQDLANSKIVDLKSSNLKKFNTRQMMAFSTKMPKIIEMHNMLSNSTSKLNNVQSKALLIGCIILYCTINIFFHRLIMYTSSPLISRLFDLTFFVFSSIGLILVHFVSSSVAEKAHSPYKTLNSIMSSSMILSSEINLNYKLRLKISGFIEKLAGPSIGFYCYDLFAFNSYNFYRFISNLIAFYFLLSDRFLTN
jgi:hypothetical protein